MNLERYPYFTCDFKDYVFFSEGPKGRIKKVVRFTKIRDNPDVYNLGFGDEHQNTGKLDSRVVTNNEDRDIVLATVAITVIEFSNHYGKHYIYIEGSTPARTRLYQIGMSAFLDEISIDFDILGSKNGALFKFQKNVNYDSFLVKRK
jgi:hypothetical protein